ncbi:flavin reductase, partial [Stenotrophomonas maltophilia]|uniref:flavin reductase n=1 Tax=Stenotrophomonas maltophilia TaxID=40324 RepID=UPI001953BE34
DVSELELAGLSTASSIRVAPPRIAESPVSFECRMVTSLVTGPEQVLVVGRVLTAHVADEYVLDARRVHIDAPRLD